MPVSELIDLYLAAWNEGNEDARAVLIARAYTEDAAYRDPLMHASTRAGIGAMIGGARTHFPGFAFEQTGGVDVVDDAVRFSWTLCSPDGTVAARGTDIMHVSADGRIRSVLGFLDQAPVLSAS